MDRVVPAVREGAAAGVALRLADRAAAARLAPLLGPLPAGAAGLVLITDDVPLPGDPPAVIVLAAGEAAVQRALRAGARAVLPPDATVEALRAVLPAVREGLVVLPPAAALALAGGLPGAASLPDPAPGGLTPREREVLSLLAAGASNKVIARRLGLSFHTAKAHVAAVLHKLGAGSRADAVARGARAGLVLL